MSTIKVNNIDPPNVGEGVSIDGLQMPTTGALSNRNRFINGSMEVAQRGTSSTANGYVSLDRWYANQSGGSTTLSQETFTVGEERSGLQNYAKYVVSTSSDFTSFRQRIENVKSVPPGSVTVSFDAKGTAPTGDLNVWMAQNFGSGGSSDVDITPQTVTLTSSWQRFSLTFTIPSISGKTVGSSSYLQVAFGQFSDTSTTAWELNITGVQLEVGSKATPFEHRSLGNELDRCKRYYTKSYPQGYYAGAVNMYGGGVIYRSNTATTIPPYIPVRFEKELRTTPNIDVYSPDTGAVNRVSVGTGTGGTQVAVTAGVSSHAATAMMIYPNYASSTAYYNCYFQYTAEAEL